MVEPAIQVALHGKHSGTGYIKLPGHPNDVVFGCVAKSICLDDLVDDFVGPRVTFDFDKEKRLIGIEILVFGVSEDDGDEDNALDC